MLDLIAIGEKITFRGKECVEIPSFSFVRKCAETQRISPSFHYSPS